MDNTKNEKAAPKEITLGLFPKLVSEPNNATLANFFSGAIWFDRKYAVGDLATLMSCWSFLVQKPILLQRDWLCSIFIYLFITLVSFCFGDKFMVVPEKVLSGGQGS